MNSLHIALQFGSARVCTLVGTMGATDLADCICGPDNLLLRGIAFWILVLIDLMGLGLAALSLQRRRTKRPRPGQPLP